MAGENKILSLTIVKVVLVQDGKGDVGADPRPKQTRVYVDAVGDGSHFGLFFSWIKTGNWLSGDGEAIRTFCAN